MTSVPTMPPILVSSRPRSSRSDLISHSFMKYQQGLTVTLTTSSIQKAIALERQQISDQTIIPATRTSSAATNTPRSDGKATDAVWKNV